MIGVLGDQHLGDQRLGRNAALDDPCRRQSLHDRALARATAVAWPARDEDAEGGWHHIEAFGHILADLVERAAAAGASLVFDIDDLLDSLEMGWQRTAVDLARTLGRSPVRLVPRMLSLSQGRLDFLKGKLELIEIELLGAAAETVTL